MAVAVRREVSLGERALWWDTVTLCLVFTYFYR